MIETKLDRDMIDYTLHWLVEQVGCDYISDLRTWRFRESAICSLKLAMCTRPEKDYIERYIKTNLSAATPQKRLALR